MAEKEDSGKTDSRDRLRSGKVRRLLEQRPHPLLMWGNVVLWIIFAALAFIAVRFAGCCFR